MRNPKKFNSQDLDFHLHFLIDDISDPEPFIPELRKILEEGIWKILFQCLYKSCEAQLKNPIIPKDTWEALILLKVLANRTGVAYSEEDFNAAATNFEEKALLLRHLAGCRRISEQPWLDTYWNLYLKTKKISLHPDLPAVILLGGTLLEILGLSKEELSQELQQSRKILERDILMRGMDCFLPNPSEILKKRPEPKPAKKEIPEIDLASRVEIKAQEVKPAETVELEIKIPEIQLEKEPSLSVEISSEPPVPKPQILIQEVAAELSKEQKIKKTDAGSKIPSLPDNATEIKTESVELQAERLLEERDIPGLEDVLHRNRSQLAGESLHRFHEWIFRQKKDQQSFKLMLDSCLESLDDSRTIEILKDLLSSFSQPMIAEELLKLLEKHGDFQEMLELFTRLGHPSGNQLKAKLNQLIQLAEIRNSLSGMMSLLEFYLEKWPDDCNKQSQYLEVLVNQGNQKQIIVQAENLLESGQLPRLEGLLERVENAGISTLQLKSLKLQLLKQKGETAAYFSLAREIVRETDDHKLAISTLKHYFSTGDGENLSLILEALPAKGKYLHLLMELASRVQDAGIFLILSRKICEIDKDKAVHLSRLAEKFAEKLMEKPDGMLRELADFFSPLLFSLTEPWYQHLWRKKCLSPDEYEKILSEHNRIDQLLSFWKETGCSGKKLQEKLRLLERSLLPEKSPFLPVVYRELATLSPDQENYRSLLQSLFDFGIYNEIPDLLWFVFRNHQDSGFCESLILQLKKNRFFPHDLKRLLILSLLKNNTSDKYAKEMTEWGTLLLREAAQLEKLSAELLEMELSEAFITATIKIEPQETLEIACLLYHEADRAGKKLLQSHLGIFLLEHGKDSFIHETLGLLMEFGEWTRALEIIESRPEKSSYLGEIKTLTRIGNERAILLLFTAFCESADFENLEKEGCLFFRGTENLLVFLKKNGFHLPYLHVLLKQQSVPDLSELFSEMVRNEDWKTLVEAAELSIQSGSSRLEYFHFLVLGLERLGRKAELALNLPRYLENISGTGKLELLIQAEEFERAARECGNLHASGYQDHDYLFRKLSEIRFKKYLKTKKEDPEFSLYMARILKSRGELQKSVAEYENYLVNYPQDEQATYELLKLCRELKYMEKLPELARKLNKFKPDSQEYLLLLDEITGDVKLKRMYGLH
ncbi:MAG: hypothetical protein PHW04_07755 [Candidatus Wallbacteria bacterium]|nr:hypothetical protein [Candidatus Wallbacteria bacterium]